MSSLSSSSSSSSPSSSSSMSFPIVVIAIVGILGTASFLLIYYVFVIKCCLNIRISDPDRILRRLSRSRRRLHRRFSFTAAVPVERRHGLDCSAIRAIPTFRYSSSDAPPAVECAVCLLEFREDELLRRLPGCAHAFHIDCIDTWLESNASCPLCRSEVTKPAEESVVIEIGEKWVGKAGSMGDECVDVRREKDERFVVQPMRRSLSMDSSGDRKLLEAVQEALRRNPELLFREEGSSSGGGGGGRRQRLLIAFGGWRSGRSSRRAVQPVEMGV
ncbi:hypothetical protein KFK09_009952 [Dendrobium nobile]|uniref:RING-type E3 ubiquitin transferase n=1 Tax=Dendrobium nobile TaxID=94219 RepID=A0A8T3BJ60_DENNO|nr:hypothetical protein KFK09_009952 [Dendrobium nobile]